VELSFPLVEIHDADVLIVVGWHRRSVGGGSYIEMRTYYLH